MAAKTSPGGFVVATVTNPGSFMATITHPTGNGYCRDRILRDRPTCVVRLRNSLQTCRTTQSWFWSSFDLYRFWFLRVARRRVFNNSQCTGCSSWTSVPLASVSVGATLAYARAIRLALRGGKFRWDRLTVVRRAKPS